ncbi:MAG: hypothetical protein APR54_04320 [Candidatus Cloacimonas sp. SDB]|nr:MAG: hypothetical protein APR54_04320 [Candidatus Cloacimonas sp. SDB]
MIKSLFISDLHGSIKKYDCLFQKILEYQPHAVFIAGDLLGSSSYSSANSLPGVNDILYDYIVVQLQKIKLELAENYPKIFVILGNDDSKLHEAAMLDISTTGLFTYLNQQIVKFGNYKVAGYPYVPPTPFLNKDWEKYDVSRYVDVGCVPPENGFRSIPISQRELGYYTIKKDLELLFSAEEMDNMICLFHAPPYQTNLDLADLEGKYIDYVPLDVHIGSIAIKDFIIARSPYLTLHGHAHESTRLTGIWKEKINNTVSLQGASDNESCFLIEFDLENPISAVKID